MLGHSFFLSHGEKRDTGDGFTASRGILVGPNMAPVRMIKTMIAPVSPFWAAQPRVQEPATWRAVVAVTAAGAITSAMANTRIDSATKAVADQIDLNEQDGRNQHNRLNHRMAVAVDGIDRQPPDPGPSANVLDDDDS